MFHAASTVTYHSTHQVGVLWGLMAKSNRRSRNSIQQNNARRQIYRPTWSAFNEPIRRDLRNVEDFRSTTRFPKTTGGTEARIISQPIIRTVREHQRTYKRPTFSYETKFANPDGVVTCVRRKQRAEVMHAKGHAGKRGQKKPSYNWRSKVRCK